VTDTSPPNRIWFLSKYSYIPRDGGPTGRPFGICRELARLGHEVLMYTSNSTGRTSDPVLKKRVDSAFVSGVSVKTLRILKYDKSNSVRRILSWLHFEIALYFALRKERTRPTHVVVSSLSMFTFLNGLIIRKRFQSILILEIRDIWPLSLSEYSDRKIDRPLIWILSQYERWIYDQADHIVGTMPKLGDHIAQVIGVNKPVTHIPMGYDPSDYSSSCKSGWDDLLRGAAVRIGYAGTLGNSNNINAILDLARHCRDRKDLEFHLLGSGPLLGDLKRSAKDLVNVSFHDAVPRDEVADFLESCDVLIVATRESALWKYGQSWNKLIDYMHIGKPILAIYDGYDDTIEASGAGECFSQGEEPEMLEFVEKSSSLGSEELERMRVQNREWLLARHSYETLACRYLAVMNAPSNLAQ